MGQFITYAQNSEDVILDAYFGNVNKGTYVDIGANHPVEDSVTKHFYEKGWRGINVEPIKELFQLLQKDRPEDINVQVGISNRRGVLQLREYANHGLSTLSSDLKGIYAKELDKKTVSYKDIAIPTITLKDLFTKYPPTYIHFMKIDVEGFEYEVLTGNDWSKYRPEMICIEANHQVKDWRPILESNSYTKVWNDGLNDYYLARESITRKNNFSYPETMLLGDQIIPYHVANQLQALSEENEKTKHSLYDEKLRLQVQDIKIKQLQHEKFLLSLQLAEQQRLRKALALLAKATDKTILAKIERLHIARTSRSLSPRSNGVGVSYDITSKTKLLTSIREADLLAYYSFSKRPLTQKFYWYHAINGSYIFLKRSALACLRLLPKLLKRGEHAEN